MGVFAGSPIEESSVDLMLLGRPVEQTIKPSSIAVIITLATRRDVILVYTYVPGELIKCVVVTLPES